MQDITKPEVMEMVISHDGRTVWINIGGSCSFRASQIGKIILDDRRIATKEAFLKNTTEDEVFAIIEEFLTRLAETGDEYKNMIILDKTKGEICRDMLR